jgi:hypothetical protein
MSTDTDLVPDLEAALEIKTVGVHIEVAAWKAKGANRRLSVGGQLLWCHELQEADYQKVRDHRDYNPPWLAGRLRRIEESALSAREPNTAPGAPRHSGS